MWGDRLSVLMRKSLEMTNREPQQSSSNLSRAWANAFLRLMDNGVREVSPLVVIVDDLKDEIPVESTDIRRALDSFLASRRLPSCHTVANTIFPESMWNSKAVSSDELLFQRFDRAWPQLKKCPANRRGTYFRRLTHFQPKGSPDHINQLEHIIRTYRKGNHRRSALQASIVDPTRDHNNCRQLGFPCLHQVAFIPEGDRLTVVGYYATQYLLDRAYGNYLGLCRLGRFMARQMQLRFSKMICIASVAQRGSPSKTTLRPLELKLEALAA
jgi:hypothetical protein